MEEEELDAVDTLLSLGEIRDDTLDEDDNSQLMPVGAPTDIIDAVPVEVRLDQIDVDNAIANIIQLEEQENPEKNTVLPTPSDNGDNVAPAKAPETGVDTTNVEDIANRPKIASPTQGSLKMRTHTLKNKTESNRRYKCSVCGIKKSSIQLVNEHHLRRHKLKICSICGCTFSLASSLT